MSRRKIEGRIRFTKKRKFTNLHLAKRTAERRGKKVVPKIVKGKRYYYVV